MATITGLNQDPCSTNWDIGRYFLYKKVLLSLRLHTRVLYHSRIRKYLFLTLKPIILRVIFEVT